MSSSKIPYIIESETRTMIDNPILDAMESGNFSRDNWTVWACQRYHASQRFIPLIESGIQLANDAGLYGISEVLEDNLEDENGTNNPQLGPHEKWRTDFYNALGVKQHELDKSILLPGTIEYRETLESLEQGNLDKIIGALLYLEYSIPLEFRRIQTGIDASFPEKFIIKNDDSKETRKQKGRARMYIDHHIIHDADSHFPDLMKSIEPLLQNGEEEEMIEGVRVIAKAKTQFYACLAKALLHVT